MNRASIADRFRAGGAVLAMALLIGVSACSAPPTTTYTNASGQEITVNWRDYPAHGYSDAAELLKAPPKETSEAIAATILADVKAALGAEFDLTWTASGEQGWYPAGGNGYGGEAMTTTFNSVSWTSDSAPSTTTDWQRIVEIINKVTTAHGLGAVKLSPNAETLKNDPAWHQELIDKYGTADLNELYWWMGTAYAQSQWLSFSITNVDRDTTGKAAKENNAPGLLPRTISISYGVTTLSTADLPAFKEALAPFEGLTPPTPTTSD